MSASRTYRTLSESQGKSEDIHPRFKPDTPSYGLPYTDGHRAL